MENENKLFATRFIALLIYSDLKIQTDNGSIKEENGREGEEDKNEGRVTGCQRGLGLL